jgi:ATP-binding cassette subfamily B (MDR/TAP) protein 1
VNGISEENAATVEKDITKLDSQVVKINENEDVDLSHLPEHEQAIIKKQIEVTSVQVNFITLYRYATRTDLIIIAVSTLCAIAGGAALPLMTVCSFFFFFLFLDAFGSTVNGPDYEQVIFGNLTGLFQSLILKTIPFRQFSHELGHFTLYFIYIAIAEFVTVYIATVGFIYTGEHNTQKIREHYLAAIVRQNIAYFDRLGAGEITTRITADTNLIQDGISEKVGLTLTAVATFVTAFVIAFIKYWSKHASRNMSNQC